MERQDLRLRNVPRSAGLIGNRANEVKVEKSKPEMVTGSNSQAQRPLISSIVIFAIVLSLNLTSALYATIPDCDEVFNYWEPTHYLAHGYGLQTWEYSPVYAIRSWLYAAIHAALSHIPFLIIKSDKAKLIEFYFLRCLFAMFSTFSQTKMYSAISHNLSPKIGLLFVAVMSPSAGMLQATPAYLPSTFAMYFVMLGTAYFLGAPSVPSKALTCYASASILGWPFSLAMIVPLAIDWMSERVKSSGGLQTFITLVNSLYGPVGILLSTLLVDSIAYRKLVLVPLNIVLYNVFAGKGKGPDIYGTEPWWFYLANLSLNFNIILPLGMIAFPVVLTMLYTQPSLLYKQLLKPLIPFYFWFVVFTLQPHKEERFMYPAYPALCLNAAISIYCCAVQLENLAGSIASSQNSRRLASFTIFTLLSLATIVSLSRFWNINTVYSAPLQIYGQHAKNITGNVCFGKEWYRYPSSYFLPSSARAKFIKSAFEGLLPGEFPESSNWSRSGTWVTPKNMNDLNQEDYSKYVDIRQCDFLVDSLFEGRQEQDSEPSYMLQSKTWKKIECRPFLDASRTPFFNRAFWIPSWLLSDRRSWGQYCLLGRRN